MRVPNDIRRCTGFIGYRTVELGVALWGTAFFVSDRGPAGIEHWVVTASHVILGPRTRSSDPDEVIVQVNVGPDFKIGIDRREPLAPLKGGR